MIINSTTSRGAMVLGAVGVIGFIVGIVVGHLVTRSSPSAEHASQITTNATTTYSFSPQSNSIKNKWMEEKDLLKTIMNSYDRERLKENHRYFTQQPHAATSARDDELANYIKDKFLQYGFDLARLVPYNLFLTKPNKQQPNSVVLTKGSKEWFRSSYKEKPIHKDDEDENLIQAFNAFTPAGKAVTAEGNGVVYVNYGRPVDFQKLVDLGVNISGNIALIRYGKVYRGNKVHNAEKAGAIGVILFSDPFDVAPEGTDEQHVYDNTIFLPGFGMQRGSTYLGDGDPLTPGWPSTEHAYRLSEEEASLHKIPSQPIGYTDATKILQLLAGPDAPNEWQGGINITYRLGPEFVSQHSDVSVTLTTHNANSIVRSYNVVGMIKGEMEADRYVMIGNHRDAWGFGGSDPSSGTAQMMETARVFGKLVKSGWRPRRTLVFNSWGAEEYGYIGSTEWVEEKVDKIQQRTVTYINTDTCASGPSLTVKGSPIMQDAMVSMAKMVPGVLNQSKTLYDEWENYSAQVNADEPEKPIVPTIGAGSDHAHFAFYAGVPVASIWFRRNKIKHDISIYPTYHTGFDTFHMVSTFVDPKYTIIEGCGRLAALSLKYFSDSSIIPYNVSRFPQRMMHNLVTSPHRDTLRTIYDKYDELERAVTRLQAAADSFMLNLEGKDFNELEQRQINDQLMQFEKTFILPEGLPGRPSTRHAIFAPSSIDTYASNGFPGLFDYMYDYNELPPTQKLQRDKQISKHISDLTILTDRAMSLLDEVYVL